MSKTFDEKYNKLVEQMCSDLAEDGLKMMTWTYENGWTFKLSIPQAKLSKLINEHNQKTVDRNCSP